MIFWKKKKKQPKKPTREELIAEATANAKAAREAIGEETLDKIAEAMRRKQESQIERAKMQIKNTDREKVVDHLRFMIDHE